MDQLLWQFRLVNPSIYESPMSLFPIWVKVPLFGDLVCVFAILICSMSFINGTPNIALSSIYQWSPIPWTYSSIIANNIQIF